MFDKGVPGQTHTAERPCGEEGGCFDVSYLGVGATVGMGYGVPSGSRPSLLCFSLLVKLCIYAFLLPIGVLLSLLTFAFGMLVWGGDTP